MKKKKILIINVMILVVNVIIKEIQLIKIVLIVHLVIILFIINQVFVFQKEINQMIHIQMKKIILIMNVMNDVKNVQQEEIKIIIDVKCVHNIQMEVIFNIYILDIIIISNHFLFCFIYNNYYGIFYKYFIII